MKKKEEVIEYKQRSNEKEISPLIEELAKKVHETWAEARISQGWTYGEQRDDKKKTHPCLVPYEKLPEEEKEYDRNTAISTLKFIMKMGYKITKEE
jgi:ryanodine receptor 2